VLQDCFNIYSNNDFLVFQCPFVPKQNKWVFPCPLPAPVNPKSSIYVNSCSLSERNAKDDYQKHHFYPVTTDVRDKLSQLVLKTPLHLGESSLVPQNSLTHDEQALLYWHRFFGHTSIKQI
jgi:hypothetical protein